LGVDTQDFSGPMAHGFKLGMDMYKSVVDVKVDDGGDADDNVAFGITKSNQVKTRVMPVMDMEMTLEVKPNRWDAMGLSQIS